jgi:hypothetical protein
LKIKQLAEKTVMIRFADLAEIPERYHLKGSNEE